MSGADIMVDATAYTSPEDRGTCGFCGKPEDGYTKRDANGKQTASCWACINKERVISDQPKRQLVGTTFTPDADEEPPTTAKKKSPGVAPSTYRPKVN
jgi:hypothetical protein